MHDPGIRDPTVDRLARESIHSGGLRQPSTVQPGAARQLPVDPTSVRDLAERTGLPQPYLEQILLSLKGVGLVRSKRGVGGGYVLARPAEPSRWPRSSRPSTVRSSPGDFGEPHQDGACDHEGQCVLLGRLGRRGQPHARAPGELHPGRHGRPGPRRQAGRANPQRLEPEILNAFLELTRSLEIGFTSW